ncbi:hypothetical protein C2G38_2268188 [Gigaspora rosea]|uniref:Uncharacterized protein n=1 Tax=Gigaspora rosea TaxID=44941 RepID=A0A397UIH6_9GLOM|nr:hypothetical protein C2G38_2268188 [Gigaspora rosea]
MAPICTLYSEFTDAKNFQGCGYKLDNRERELESQYNELLLETEFFANKCSKFRNAKALAEARSDVITKELEKKNTNLTEYKAKYYSKLEEANSFQSRIKLLEEELSLTQKYSSKKDSEIMSLKAELVNIKIELDSKVSELERLKSEDISVPMVGGDSEKNMSKSNNISTNLQKSMPGLFLR